MKKLNTEYWKKLLETVAFSNGEISLYELVQKEHRHFHPSGNPTPSKEDIKLTERIALSGKLLGIDLLDHIIIGKEDKPYLSMIEEGIIPPGGMELLKRELEKGHRKRWEKSF